VAQLSCDTCGVKSLQGYMKSANWIQKIMARALFTALIAVGCGPSSNTATSGPDLNSIAAALKGDYYFKTPKTPAYFEGEPPIISAAHLTQIPSFLRAGILITNADYSYCNLTPAQWTALRAQPKAVFMLVWSSVPDARGDREVATVDLNTDVFDLLTSSASDFTNHLTHMESTIRKATGQADFSLIGQKP